MKKIGEVYMYCHLLVCYCSVIVLLLLKKKIHSKKKMFQFPFVIVSVKCNTTDPIKKYSGRIDFLMKNLRSS